MASNYRNENIIAMIPARMGSERLPMKNLALLNGKPLIYYAIKAAKDAEVFGRVVINSEDRIFAKIAKRYRIEFYQRPLQLGASATKSDFVVYDFIQKNPCDILVWVNPISPLQTAGEIGEVTRYFLKERLDSLIAVKDEQVHCVYKGRPVNFTKDGVFARTQELDCVQPFVYSIMMWRTSVFRRAFERKGHAFFCGKVGFYPVSKFSAISIKKKEDLMMADYLLRATAKGREYKVCYDRIIKDAGKDKG